MEQLNAVVEKVTKKQSQKEYRRQKNIERREKQKRGGDIIKHSKGKKTDEKKVN